MNTETDLNMMFASEPTIKSKFKVDRKSDSGTAKYTKWNYLNTQDSANVGKFVMQVKIASKIINRPFSHQGSPQKTTRV
jgi:hypothetical protein